MDTESSKYMTLNTCKGLLASNRLCFGIKTAPAQFQRIMDKILVGIPGVRARLDDILVATVGGSNNHFKVLKQVFDRLTKHNVKLNGEKCQFFQSEVKYMGYKLNSQGVSPLESKLGAIKNALRPTNRTELKSFLGMVNYYSRFLPDLSTILSPLYNLTKLNQHWHWNDQCEDVFNQAKAMVSSDKVLVHYEQDKELYLRVDASPYGLGAVLCHKIDKVYSPIAFASRTLNTAEKIYAQIEKESLATFCFEFRP